MFFWDVATLLKTRVSARVSRLHVLTPLFLCINLKSDIYALIQHTLVLFSPILFASRARAHSTYTDQQDSLRESDIPKVKSLNPFDIYGYLWKKGFTEDVIVRVSRARCDPS